MRQIISTTKAGSGHWVGDGFPVRSLFSHMGGGDSHDPFLMLDYAGPQYFEPAKKPRGVDAHPHKGFETVTIVYQGEVEHGDSTGEGGVIREGDVQWMTAGDGILHKEFHSRAFTARGGTLEMVQLWVNLPARHKSAKPGYQAITDAQIPVVDLPDSAGRLRVIAGDHDGTEGPARTFTPIEVWDLRLNAGKQVELTPPEGQNVTVVLLEGTATLNGAESLNGAAVARLDDKGSFTVDASTDVKLLVLAGAPIKEPIAPYGPFVMNTAAEIHEAIAEFQAGKFGAL
ncbi:quercetin 2,3-dioxygenase [Maritimibacter sp. 55A14]|uniref:pirin family protein n=1 Tax=Maritimibacter sp. 55A14 TaxID=2174844 RepID=UPI000D6073D5|nr:pirin family protein [Maritimibacter sp. 55A14]PWE32871.1 quercetin 2,3-dioxygenase [Maritimibacter sp. 55A14]